VSTPLGGGRLGKRASKSPRSETGSGTCQTRKAVSNWNGNLKKIRRKETTVEKGRIRNIKVLAIAKGLKDGT